MKHYNYFKYIIFFIFLLGCNPTTKFSGIFFPQYSDADFTALQRQYPDAGAVVLLDEAVTEIYDRNTERKSIIHRKTAIKILNKRGNNFANVIIPYESHMRIKNIQAKTILPDGSEIKVLQNQIYDTNLYTEYVYYSDARSKRFTMPGIKNGCIVEYSWDIVVNDLFIMSEWPFQRDIPTLVSRYKIISPESINLKWKIYGDEKYIHFEESVSFENITRIWQSNNIPPYIKEFASAPGTMDLRKIIFSPIGIHTWNDIGDWYLDLAKDRMRPNKEIKEFTEQLVNNTKSQYSKLKHIFNYVHSNLRYIAIEIGKGGYQPHFASTILRNSYGDCKDMATLIIAMANSLGIKTFPVLISTWYNGKIDTHLVSNSFFNHVMVKSELENGQEIWMDPTEKYIPFGKIPWYDQNRNVLVVKEKESKITVTPSYPSDYNLSERVWDMKIFNNGTCSGTIAHRIHGSQALEIRHQLNDLHPSNYYTWLTKNIFGSYSVNMNQLIDIENLNELNQPLKVTGNYSSSLMVLKSDHLYTIFLDALSTFNLYKMFPSIYRSSDIVLKHPLKIIDKVNFTYPESWKCISSVLQDSVGSEFGTYEWDFIINKSGSASFSREFDLNTTHIPVEKYLKFKKFLTNIALSEQKLILFRDQVDKK